MSRYGSAQRKGATSVAFRASEHTVFFRGMVGSRGSDVGALGRRGSLGPGAHDPHRWKQSWEPGSQAWLCHLARVP